MAEIVENLCTHLSAQWFSRYSHVSCGIPQCENQYAQDFNSTVILGILQKITNLAGNLAKPLALRLCLLPFDTYVESLIEIAVSRNDFLQLFPFVLHGQKIHTLAPVSQSETDLGHYDLKNDI